MINPIWNTRIKWFNIGFFFCFVVLGLPALYALRLGKQVTDLQAAKLEELTSTGTLLTESEPVAQPMSVLGGLLTIEPSFAGERAVPVWGISCKGEARLLGSPRPNHVYYWIDTKTRKIEGPFAPVVQPQ